ncbi:glycerate kinase [Nocardia arthritidis]|uniref:Glycerate kinase n=1 Tax=Nocardia arthritidis TaxID=228602 RepID=A0A6G9YI57_9NOCA|nr:glycerate kinase [Nocardia arthritidis]QIS12892.1 glycerate kinase [Nocardia arthritidis]
MRVLVAPDKFKGSLPAAAVARCLARGLAAGGAHPVELPLADGGDGSVAAAVAAGYTAHPVTVAGATGLPHRGRIAVRGRTALVEVADTCGLSTLPGGRPRPLDASSLGFGQVVRHNPNRLVLALGGSASTDGGLGLLTALGVRCLDDAGHPVYPRGRALHTVARINMGSAVTLSGVDLVVASDVTNPLTGPNGAAAVFGPQKGASAAQVHRLDRGLTHLVDVLTDSGYPRARVLAAAAGAGSAGGIGFAAALLGARIVSGAEFFLDLLDFDAHLAAADLVITGEGCLDEQSTQGKLPTAVARRAAPTPVIAVAGRRTLSRSDWATSGFADVHTLAEYTSADTSRDPALTEQLLSRIGERIASSVRAAPKPVAPQGFPTA